MNMNQNNVERKSSSLGSYAPAQTAKRKSFRLNPVSQAITTSLLLLFSGGTYANCVIDDIDVTCDSDTPNPYTTPLNFSGKDNVNVTVKNGATLDVGENARAIMTGVNANLHFESNSVTHNITGSYTSDLIAVGAGSHITVDKNALLNSEGTNGGSETIQMNDGGNTVENNGSILSSGAFAINVVGGSNNVVINNGIIRGGKGAICWNSATPTDITIINSGILQGNSGVAIDLGTGIGSALGGSATLVLEEGSQIIGNVVSNAQSRNTLVLGGDAKENSGGDTFSVDTIGDAAQYQHFKTFKKQGTSTWTLDGVASQDIGWEIDDGTLVFGSSTQGNGILNANGGDIGYLDGVTLDNEIRLNQDANVDVKSGQAIQNGAISGVGALTKTGAGSLILEHDNSYTGKTTIENGTLQLGNGGTTGMVSGDIINNAALIFDHSNALEFGGVISGSGNLIQSGTGDLTLTGDNTFTGQTIVNNGNSLTLGNGGTTGRVAGDIVNNGTVTINHSDNVTMGGKLSGTGTLNQTGKGTTTITSASSSQGAVSATSGTLDFAQVGDFTTGALDIASTAMMKLENQARVNVSGAASLNGGLDIQITQGAPLITAESVTLGADSTLNVTGLAGIPDTASQIAQTHTTVLQTTDGISGDFAHVNLGNTSHPDYLLVNGTKSPDGKSYSVGQELAWTSATRGANGNFTLAGASDHFNVDVALEDQHANAATGWDGKSLTKAGSGNLTLSAANTYTGNTSVQAGTLTAGAAHTLDSTSNVDVASGATVNLNNNDQTLHGLTGKGHVALGNATLRVENNAPDTFAGVISGPGSLIKADEGTLTLTGKNTFTGDTTIEQGTLQIGDNTAAGAGSLAGNIIDNANLSFALQGNSTYSGQISGQGQLSQVGSGTTTLAGENSFSGGSRIESGTLSLANNRAAGTGAINVSNDGQLDLAFSNGAFTNQLTGAGKVNVSGQNVGLEEDAGSFTGAWDVTGSASASQQSQLGNAGVLLEGENSKLTLDNFTSAFTNALTGNGTLQVHQNSQTTDFSLASTTGSAFTGTVEMQQGNLVLDDNAEKALANSTLALTHDSMVSLDSDRTLNNFIFGGGTLRADNSRTEAHTLTTQDFDASAGGSIYANIPVELSPPVVPTNPSYFDQDIIRTVQVVKATGEVTGQGKHISLNDYDGDSVSNPTQVTIVDGTHEVGTATYDNAAVVTEDGVWVGYDLVNLSVNAGQTLVLQNDPGHDAALIAQLSGAGNFDIQADGTVILNNSDNNYTGDTLVNRGNLQLGSDNALGHTADVSLATGAGLDINGKKQTITSLHGAAGSSLNLNGGELSINQGGQSLGSLSGAGALNLNGGELNVSGANQSLSATTNIADSATATLDNTQGLGSGEINLAGHLNLSGANGVLANQMNGNGTLSLQDGAQVTLTNTAQAFGGDIHVADGTQLTAQGAGTLGTANLVDDGTLVLDTASDWTLTNAISGTGGLNKTGAGTLFVGEGQTYSGDTHVDQGALQVNGRLASTGNVYVGQAGTLKGTDNSSIAGSVVNDGVIDLTSNTPGNNLTIDGNYTSHDGKLWLNSDLADDNAAHDQLTVKGNTSGNTQVTVNNMHGLGAQTANGIELVDVQGQSDGTFTLKGRAVAGAYEYSLNKANNGSWYLQSTTDIPDPDPTPDPDPDPTPDPTPSASILRPEAGAYLANQSLANSVFMNTLHDRSGVNRPSGEDAPATWARFDAGRTNSKGGSDALSMGSNTSVLRMGSDVFRHDFGDQRINAGVMTGYANADTDSDAKHVSSRATGKLKGYNVGVYGTWYGGAADQNTGPYLDSWMQYGTFRNSVKGDDLAEEKYHAHNWMASIEAGYDMPLAGLSSVYIQPQFQTIYTHYSQSDFDEDNGTHIHSKDAGGVTTRLGARLYGDLDTAAVTQPFVEVNWWHGGSDNSVQMDSHTVDQSVPVNRYETKVGAQVKLNKSWTLWVNSGVQTGDDHYSSVQGQFGGKYTW